MIGIIGAMDEEVASLKGSLENKETFVYAGMEFCKGILEGKDVVVAQSGIGKVNMAACTQIMVDRFGVDCLINTGIAGSLNADIDIADIVLATDAVQYDIDITAFGNPRGQIEGIDVLAFPCDEKLRKLAAAANEKVNPGVKAHAGRVATGDRFVFQQEIKDDIAAEFGAYCCEMEGGAMAHTAYINKVPCLIIRAISDKADGSEFMEYPDFKVLAVANTVRLLHQMLKDM